MQRYRSETSVSVSCHFILTVFNLICLLFTIFVNSRNVYIEYETDTKLKDAVCDSLLTSPEQYNGIFMF